MTSTSASGPAWFNALEETAARTELHAVCAATAWVRHVLAARPFVTTADLYAVSDAAVAALTDEGLAEAMAGHAPIGRPKPGDAVSAREQSGMAGASTRLTAEIRELNLAYQQTFGHVFLICATGRTGEQMRDALKERLGNPPALEREIVRTELGKINRIRLARLVEQDARP